MQKPSEILAFILLSLFLTLGPTEPLRAQAPVKGGSGVETDKPPIKGGSSVTIEPPKPANSNETRGGRPIPRASVSQSKGYLSLSAVAGAKVTITPTRKATSKSAAKSFTGTVGEDGTLTRADMSPGKYAIEIEHENYRPYREQIEVKAGAITPINASSKLVSLYGEIAIVSDPKEITVLLDGQAWSSENVKATGEGKRTLLQVPVGKHRLQFRKAGYDEAIGELVVDPGRQTPVAVNLALSTVTLTIQSLPGARVYLDNVDKGTVQLNGTLIIPELPPGAKALRVLLDGYEPYEKSLRLGLEERSPVEAARLPPIAESKEAHENFSSGVTKWVFPAEWKIDERGLQIRGDQPGLFKGTAEKRSFNQYRDFDLEFDLRFINGRGAAWIVRAKDTQNYYLFELTTINSSIGKRRFNFYLCRDGQCALKDSHTVVEILETPDDSYHLRLEARGPRMVHKISLLKKPRLDDPQPLGSFEDNTFSVGGVGFRGINGAEALLQNLVILPVQSPPLKSP
jgi:hypothetical protein